MEEGRVWLRGASGRVLEGVFGLEVRLGGGVFGLEEGRVWLRGASGRVLEGVFGLEVRLGGGGVWLGGASYSLPLFFPSSAYLCLCPLISLLPSAPLHVLSSAYLCLALLLPSVPLSFSSVFAYSSFL